MTNNSVVQIYFYYSRSQSNSNWSNTKKRVLVFNERRFFDFLIRSDQRIFVNEAYDAMDAGRDWE